MGYYDDTEHGKRNKGNKGGSKAGYFFSALLGVIIGALLVWLIVPSLSNSLPGSTSNSVNKTETPQLSTEISTNVTDAVDKTKDSVIGITNIQKKQSTEDIFGGGKNTSDEESSSEAGSGSGVVYKKDGGKAYIVTNNHVVDEADALEVTLADGKKVDAKLVGKDQWTDLAVISIDAKHVTQVAKFGDSDKLKQGESVIAIGNPLGLDLYGSVTTGVISGKDRTVPMDINGDGTADWNAEVLQTDAAISPGNSGGALINLAGQVIGINSMKISQSQAEGLGFSIPINTAIPVIEELEKKGKVERPAMGVSLIDLADVPAFYQNQTLELPNDVTSGVVVGSVESGSAADKAGIKQYDVIVEMDGKKVSNSIELRKILYSKNVGDSVKVKLYSGGKAVNKTIDLKSTIKN
ncbi:S1C family serine protease [Kurthia sibirica]|uniref:2-alkenal reductase n=1 Tax=Kurthia sibirica TaxID=202750 RepID=A0A2U3AME1_9BACL|nr:trypsin-like peptidase domain-containing protein [Kurthia sibirica]PWI25710.1 2-alkenal reductase [Kurthia sibirica]GEK33716.1 serine protease [Kurthia sibirica]